MTLFGEVSGKWLHVAPIESTDLSNSAGARSSLQRNNKKYKHKGFYRIVRSLIRPAQIACQPGARRDYYI